MDPAQFSPLLGWVAYLSAVATFITLVTGILFFAKGGLFGPMNDAASVFQMLLMLPIAAAFFLLTRPNAAGLALLAAAIGSVGMLIAAALQTLLVLGAVEYTQTIATVLAAGAAVGLWLIVTNSLALSTGILPGVLAPLGIAVGAGHILTVIGFRIGGQQHPLFYLGALFSVFGYSIWAFWLGRLFLSGGLAVSI